MTYMKKKEKQSLQQMTKEELVKVLVDAEMALALGQKDRYSKQSKNRREGKILRKKVAIVQTLLRQKELVHG